MSIQSDNAAAAAELEKALTLLPHGPEFRFIDQLLEMDPGRSGTGTYLLKASAEFLKGHFPGAPLMPGVLIAEAAAQLVGVVGQSDPKQIPLKAVRLTAVRGMKWKGAALPGQTIVLEAREVTRFGNFIQAKVTATVEDNRIMQGEITLSGEIAE